MRPSTIRLPKTFIYYPKGLLNTCKESKGSASFYFLPIDLHIAQRFTSSTNVRAHSIFSLGFSFACAI